MPTTKPRYVVTDTGATAEMLDRAQQAWPDVADRKELLLRLAALGRDAIEANDVEAGARRSEQREALARGRSRVDVDVLMGDAAWQ